MRFGSRLFLNLFFGFCPLTVWEEKLRKKVNPDIDFHNSFMATYINSFFGTKFSKRIISKVSLGAKLISYAVSILLLTVFK